LLAAVFSLASLAGGDLTPVTLALQPRAARTAPDGASGSPLISGDGRYVFFASDAGNLVTNALENWGLNLYRWDRETKTTELVSTGMGATPLGGIGDYSVSESGERAVFSGPVTSFQQPSEGNVFLRDVRTETTTLISRRRWELEPIPGNGPSWNPTLSADGQRVVFESMATDLESWTGGPSQLALVMHETGSGESHRFVVDRFGTLDAEHQASRDADVVVFRNPEPQYFPGGNRWTSLMIWRRGDGNYVQVGLSRPPSEEMGAPFSPWKFALSPNGKRLAFYLEFRAGPDGRGIWIYDLETAAAQRILPERPFGYFDQLSWSDDGSRLAVLEGRPEEGVESRVHIWTEETGVRTLAAWVESPAVAPADPTSISRCELSPDGRYLLFRTSEGIPAAGAPEDGVEAHYLRELATGKTRRIATEQADLEAAFSADGRWLAYQSSERMDSSDDNESSDVFVMELPDGAPERVSVGLPSAPLATANGGSWVDGGLSDDGRWIVFSSSAGDLAPNDDNGRRDVFVHDRLLRTNVLVSVGQDGHSAAAGARWGRISANGRSVLFLSTSPDLTGSPTNEGPNLFVRDLSAGRTALVSTDPDTGKALGQTPANVWITGDGRQVVMDLHAAFIQQEDQWLVRPARLLLWNQSTGVTEDLLRRLTNVAGAARSPYPASIRISRDADVLLFSSWSEDGDFLEVWDRPAGTLTRLPVRKDSHVTDLSPDGRWVLTQHGPVTGYDPIQDAWITTPRSYALYDRVRGVAAPVSFPASMTPSVPQFTGDSQHLAFFSPVGGEGSRPPQRQLLLYSLRDGTISPILDDTATDFGFAKAQLSPDVRWMIFSSLNSGAMEGDDNEALDVFLYDRYSRSLRPLSTHPGGATGDAASVGGRLSADGRFFAFTTFAGDLLPGDDSRHSDVAWGAVEAAAPLDADADGLPDVWEQDHFGSLAGDAAGDPDNDGQSNREEYLARTVPSDAASRLVMVGAGIRPDGLEVSWEGHAGVTYRLERSETLGAGSAWIPAGDPVAGYQGVVHQEVSGKSATGFFRVVVVP